MPSPHRWLVAFNLNGSRSETKAKQTLHKRYKRQETTIKWLASANAGDK